MEGATVGRWMGLGVVGTIVAVTRRLGIKGLLARVIIALQGWTPLIITVTKTP